MGFFDALGDALSSQAERNFDHFKQKVRSSSDDELRNWWNAHQYDDYEYADRARDFVKAEMEKRGMYY